jgi:hypothetical protein
MARGLAEPRLYLLLLLSLALGSLAYQYKTSYTVDFGGPGDDAYVSGFNAKEHNPALNYRWSGPRSVVRFPGIGNEPVLVTLVTVGYRPSGEPPVITVEARGLTRTIQTHKEPHSDSFTVPRGDPGNGHFDLRITSPVFSPPGDSRRLGVIVDKVTVAPGGTGLSPLVVPPPDTMGFMLVGLGLCFLVLLLSTGSIRWALGGSYILALAACTLVIFTRPELGLLAPEAPSVAAWGLALAVIGRVVLSRDNRRWTIDNTRGTKQDRPSSIIHRLAMPGNLGMALGTLAFAGAFLLRFGGLIYPQFLTSDILLHVHNMQRVLSGQWVFPGNLPDGTPVPYPPALYVLVSPLAALLGTSDDTLGLILKLTTSLLDSATCLGLAWAGTRLWPGAAGGIAAVAYAVSPAPFDLFSAGNYSNLFGQGTLNLTLLLGLVYLAERRDDGRWTTGVRPSIVHRPSSIVRPRYPELTPALMAAGFFLTVLGHYGMMLAALAIMGLFALWALVARHWPGRKPEWEVIGAFVVALAGSFASYYWRFGAEMWAQLSGVVARAGGARTGPASVPRLGFDTVLRKLGEKIGLLIGFLQAACGIFGAALLGGIGVASRALLLCWLGATALFALLDQTLGDAIRWYYLGAAGIALLAGRFLGLLLWRGRAARWLVALSLMMILVHLLGFWVGDLIMSRYH